MNITPSNHTQALRWLLTELHGGNAFAKDTLWTWLQQANVAPSSETERFKDALLEVVTDRQLEEAKAILDCATTHPVITDAQFQERFAPMQNHLNPDAPFDGCMFETFGAEAEFVRAQDPALIWTVLDCDGTMCIESGFHFVNRLGYLVASQPRRDQSAYSVGDDLTVSVLVNRSHLRAVLDYLHDSEADHYQDTVESYPEEVNTHVYSHVLAIEAELEGGAS